VPHRREQHKHDRVGNQPHFAATKFTKQNWKTTSLQSRLGITNKDNEPPKLAWNNKRKTTDHKPQHSLRLLFSSSLQIFNPLAFDSQSLQDVEKKLPTICFKLGCELQTDATDGWKLQMLRVIALWKANTIYYHSWKFQNILSYCPKVMDVQSSALHIHSDLHNFLSKTPNFNCDTFLES